MRICVVCWLLAALPLLTQGAVTPPGAGTTADPYRIAALGHLVWMSETAGDSVGKTYVLTADIDATETARWNDAGTDETVLEGFPPIGTDSAAFSGRFDGQGHAMPSAG